MGLPRVIAHTVAILLHSTEAEENFMIENWNLSEMNGTLQLDITLGVIIWIPSVVMEVQESMHE